MKSGKLERLLEFTGEFTAQFAGATDSKVLFLVNYLDADLAPLSEYSSQNPEGDYAEYLDEMWSRHSVSELRLYDMDMSAYDVVDSGDLWLSSSQTLCRYGDFSLYAKGGGAVPVRPGREHGPAGVRQGRDYKFLDNGRPGLLHYVG